MRRNVDSSDFCRNFAPQNASGELAERLGNGLQNRVQQFDSATHLYHFIDFRWNKLKSFLMPEETDAERPNHHPRSAGE